MLITVWMSGQFWIFFCKNTSRLLWTEWNHPHVNLWNRFSWNLVLIFTINKRKEHPNSYLFSTIQANNNFRTEHPHTFRYLKSIRFFFLANTLRPRQNGRHFPDEIFKCILSIKISLAFVPKGPINNIPSLVQIMAWRWPCDKPLSEPMMVKLLTHIWVNFVWPQWINLIWPNNVIWGHKMSSLISVIYTRTRPLTSLWLQWIWIKCLRWSNVLRWPRRSRLNFRDCETHD